ncbi:MAG: hypothetical protein U1E67_07800 [Hyphomicrobiales bacterium]
MTRKIVDGIIETNAASAAFFDLMAGNAEAYMIHAVDLPIQDPMMRLVPDCLRAGWQANQLCACTAGDHSLVAG